MIDRNDLKDDKYYVYEHWFNNECIYVGKGRKRRPFQFKSKRNDIWKNIAGDRYDDISVRIIKEFDTNIDAVKFESELTMRYIKNGQCIANNGRCGHSLFGEDNPFFGKSHSKETKDKIRSKLKGKYCGENNPFYGKTHTEENKKKMLRSIKVYCVELDVEFDSILDVARYFGVKNTGHISSRMRSGKPYKGVHLVELKKEGTYYN